MTPDAIHAILTEAFPGLRTGEREPTGYSWLDGTPRRDRYSNRIVRAVAKDHSSDARLKLSVTSRIEHKNVIRIRFTKNELSEMVTEELRLYRDSLCCTSRINTVLGHYRKFAQPASCPEPGNARPVSQ